MPKRPNIEGAKSFQFRNGADGFFWKGMATKVDPGAQPPDRPRIVVNGRYIGGAIVARQPFTDTSATIPRYTGPNSTSFEWSPTAMFDHHSYAGVRAWFGGHLPVQESDTGGSYGYIDSDWDPEFSEVALTYAPTDASPHIERFANFVYVGGTDALRRVYRFEGAPGKYRSAYGFDGTDEVVATFPGFRVAALHRHAGMLFFVLVDPTNTTTGFVYSWNGFEVVEEYALTVSGHQGAAMTTYLNSLVVTVRGLGSILIRDVSGNWTTATTGGFDSSGYFNSMATLKEYLYIMSGGTIIYRWNGAALSVAHTIATATSPEEANCCVAWNGRLYYAWSEYVGAGGAYGQRWPWLGVYDPDTVDSSYQWHDDYVDFNHSVGNVSLTDGHDTGGQHPYLGWGVVAALAVYRQRIIAAVGSVFNPGVTNEKYTNIVTHSVTNNPYSDWHIAHPNAYVVSPTGPLYFPLDSAASNPYRLIDYFKVF